jgi:hypothetical protein
VRTSWWRAARQGFVVGFANPKALIMFGTVPAWVLAASRARTWFGTDPRRLAMGRGHRRARDDRGRGERRRYRAPGLT